MNFLKHHLIIIGGAAVLSMSIILFAIWGISGSRNLSAVVASRMDLQEVVSGSGVVKASSYVDMAFEKGGTIAVVYHQAGDGVWAGQAIVALNASDLLAQLAQAEADIKTQQARLDELKRGARQEDLDNQNIAVNNAEMSLLDANQGLFDKLQDAYTKADDAIRGKVDQMFSNPRSANPQLLFTIADSLVKADIESSRTYLESSLVKWKNSLDSVSASDDLNQIKIDATQNLRQIKVLLDKISLALNDPNNCTIDYTGVCQPISSTWKSDISAARTNINTAISNLNAASGALNLARSGYYLADQGLTIKEAGSAPEQIAAQEAQLERAKATVDLVKAQISKTVLRAPFDGIVSRQDAKVGAIAIPNQTLVSVISSGKYNVEIFVPETEIVKIKAGQPAKITLDAYGSGREFDAMVVAVDPAATALGGVSSYKVTLQFKNDETEVKAGMGANVKIMAASRSGVLAIPESAVITRNSDRVVIVPGQGGPIERKVQTGISGTNGFVEVLSGVKEGEKITTFGGAQK